MKARELGDFDVVREGRVDSRINYPRSGGLCRAEVGVGTVSFFEINRLARSSVEAKEIPTNDRYSVSGSLDFGASAGASDPGDCPREGIVRHLTRTPRVDRLYVNVAKDRVLIDISGLTAGWHRDC